MEESLEDYLRAYKKHSDKKMVLMMNPQGKGSEIVHETNVMLKIVRTACEKFHVGEFDFLERAERD